MLYTFFDKILFDKILNSFNPIQDGGTKKFSAAIFPPLTSPNVGAQVQNFLTF